MWIWFRDQAAFEAFRDGQEPAFRVIIAEDEHRFLDRASMVMFVTEDVDSKQGSMSFK